VSPSVKPLHFLAILQPEMLNTAQIWPIVKKKKKKKKKEKKKASYLAKN